MKQTRYELFDLLYDNYSNFAITAHNLGGTTETIISSDDARKYMIRHYATRISLFFSKNDSITLNDASLEFYNRFLSFMNLRANNIDKMYQALFNYDYSPIENTDRYETETINNSENATQSNTVRDNGTDTRNITTDSSGSTTDNNDSKGYKSGFNNASTYTPDTRMTEENKGTTTEKITTGDSNTFEHSTSENETENREGVTLRDLHTHGNIGVTTNTELITDEINLRKLSLANLLLDEFINEYTFYV